VKTQCLTFPNKKRIGTELFIDERATLYIQNGEDKVRAKVKRIASFAPKNNPRRE